MSFFVVLMVILCSFNGGFATKRGSGCVGFGFEKSWRSRYSSFVATFIISWYLSFCIIDFCVYWKMCMHDDFFLFFFFFLINFIVIYWVSLTCNQSGRWFIYLFFHFLESLKSFCCLLDFVYWDWWEYNYFFPF